MIKNNIFFPNTKVSLSNKFWVKPSKIIQQKATNFQKIFSLPYPILILLAQKGLKINDIENFLNPMVKFNMPDPYSLFDVKKAVEIIFESIKSKKTIAIFADYDVDGGSSAAMLFNWFENFEIKPTIYVPDRDKEGYGPNNKAMAMLSKNHDIIICVDCGSVANQPIEIAKKNKRNVIVIDHHQGGNNSTKADALINPNRLDEKSSLHYLCATGVTFLLIAAINKKLKKNKYEVPNIIYYLDLVALATIADVVPLIGLNRAFVRSGLKIIEKQKNIGIQSLIKISNIKTQIKEKHLGFILGPKINASGRMGASKLGVDLLIEKNPTKAINIARTLDSLNENRKYLEKNLTEKAFKLIKNNSINKDFIWVADKEFKAGVIGIIASRIVEKFHKTCFVFSIDNNGIFKGSGRAIPNNNHNLGKAIYQLLEEKIITKGGGHSKAAGITLDKKNIQQVMNRFAQILLLQNKKKEDIFELDINSVISINSATSDFIEELDKAGPFGPDAPSPIFMIKNCKIKWCKVLNNKHLSFYIYDESFKKMQSIFFRALDNEAGIFLYEHLEDKFHFAGNLEINDWSGKKVPKFIIKDITLAN